MIVAQQTYQPKSNGELVQHNYYSLSYIEEHEQAEWVYYKLTSEMINGTCERTDNFRADPDVSTFSAGNSDYYKTGYDRGHLAPAADMKISEKAMSESFYMSNMSPQNPSFNRGGWKSLESLVRSWVLTEGEMYVVTGAIFSNILERIGPSNVTVPGYYYKIIYSKENNNMIGLIMPNEKTTNDLNYYVQSVDSIESLTGIDFFYQIDDETENKLEANKNDQNWNFNTVSKITSKNNSISSSQCNGISKSTSKRCRNKTKNENSYCYVHKSQSPVYVSPKKSDYVGRCTAKTKKGSQCKRNSSNGTRYCWQHQ